MNRLYNTYRDEGFIVLGVNVKDEDEKAVRRFAKKRKLGYPVLLNGRQTGRKWGVKRLPTVFVIDRAGKVVKSKVGFDSGDEKILEEAIRKQLAR